MPLLWLSHSQLSAARLGGPGFDWVRLEEGSCWGDGRRRGARGVLLPGLDVLGHDAPRQVVVAVVAPGVVKEVGPGGEDVAGEHGAALEGGGGN